MEMHQVRYFLAVARTLNFTRAAEECHVAQPSLTRAIRQLESELGGDLFRRERPHAQLTELGQRMIPLLQKCYDSALGARSLASSIKSGEIGALRIALSWTIDPALVVPHVMELVRHFSGLELKFWRGTGAEVAECLKRGDAELGIAASAGEGWERLDRWPLFTETFELAIGAGHQLADRAEIGLDELRDQRILVRTYCEQAAQFAEALDSRDIRVDRGHEMTCERDLFALLEANLGIAVVPHSVRAPETVRRAQLKGLDLRRTISLYGVAGRERTAVGAAAMKMLRAYDWSKYVN